MCVRRVKVVSCSLSEDEFSRVTTAQPTEHQSPKLNTGSDLLMRFESKHRPRTKQPPTTTPTPRPHWPKSPRVALSQADRKRAILGLPLPLPLWHSPEPSYPNLHNTMSKTRPALLNPLVVPLLLKTMSLDHRRNEVNILVSDDASYY